MRHPDIARLVETFYGRARADALLGPVFDAVVADWPHHFAALTGFWAAQLRGRGSYHGQPIAVHRAQAHRITPAMFDRWLMLWDHTTAQVMSPPDAEALQARARRIAAVLRGAMADTPAWSACPMGGGT
ncbi:preprotein translocase subunit TatC [Novosphingobium sp. FSY-8]|uniref:Preprotein translocase subunit TatC n=1 Tax=Novosphingobium ovatum TaxID=1908523 RepID=A0ABW9XH19_9SPHN|nr:preprotein translocase subunit TatC [Novosphingobium ovatum]